MKVFSAEEKCVLLPEPHGKLSVVLDTDAYNEVDDQFAIAYALFSGDRLDIEAIYAAPFVNDHADSAGDGMNQSYEEILRIMKLCSRETAAPVYKGAERFLEHRADSVQCEAVDDLIFRALRHTKERPLYVVSIGAPTNVASALIKCPEICGSIVVLWLGGNSLEQQDAREFNLEQDIIASQTLFCGHVPLVLFPCGGVTDRLRLTTEELRRRMVPSELSDYLVGIVEKYKEKEYGDEKVIWDIIPFTWLINDGWVRTELFNTPVLSDDCRWCGSDAQHLVRCAVDVDKDAAFQDLFIKLNGK